MGRSGSAAALAASPTDASLAPPGSAPLRLGPLRRRLAPVCQDKPWSGDSDDEASEENDDEE